MNADRDNLLLVLTAALEVVAAGDALRLAEWDDGEIDDGGEAVSVPSGPELVLDEVGGVRTETLHVHFHSHRCRILAHLALD